MWAMAMVSSSSVFQSPADQTIATPQTPPRTPVKSQPVAASASAYEVRLPSHTGVVVGWHRAGALTQGVQGASVRRFEDGPSSSPLSPSQTFTSPKTSSTKLAYVVYQGREVGVFHTWCIILICYTYK